ncbi:MAG: YihY/virulence factor BrkB family protein [Immundisolibacteraceae bacterium]|nr:YihY/virulence factor BrkB family protein [Immundisolibacteraceae bacterium]
MATTKATLSARLEQHLWARDLGQSSQPGRWVIVTMRVITAVVRDLFEGQITLRAMGMVYSTLLSMVPLLAISFSLVKGLGVVDNQLEPMLLNFVAPMGAQGEEIVGTLLGFVNNVNAGALGTIGLLVLIWTVVSLLQKIEGAFNFIWHVNQSRHFARRFSDFFIVLLIGPLLVGAALTATGAALNNKFVLKIASIEPFGTLLLLATQMVPYLLITLAFTFVYMFIANTRVKLNCALPGALVAGILWETLGKTFSLIFGSSATLAIYSSFAILILFLVWLYWSWLILLIGAQVAFYVQNPQYLRSGHRLESLNSEQQEYLALALLSLVGDRFVSGDAGLTTSSLSDQIGLPEESIMTTLTTLQTLGLLKRSQDQPSLWILSRDPDQVGIGSLLQQLRQSRSGSSVAPQLQQIAAAQQVQQRWQDGAFDAVAGQTLRQLLSANTATVENSNSALPST